MAEDPKKTPAASDAEGAGTTDVLTDPTAELHSLRAQLAEAKAAASAAQAATAVGQVQAALTNTVAPIPPAPEGPLITKRDDRNGHEQSLPAVTWDLLSPDEKKHFHVASEAPKKLATK